MSVEEGTVHGFLGPNGAGKSTTIRTLLGLLHPTAGKVRVLGKNPLQHPEILRRIGYVPGDVALWPALTGLETLNALESLRGWTVISGSPERNGDTPCSHGDNNSRQCVCVASAYHHSQRAKY